MASKKSAPKKAAAKKAAKKAPASKKAAAKKAATKAKASAAKKPAAKKAAAKKTAAKKPAAKKAPATKAASKTVKKAAAKKPGSSKTATKAKTSTAAKKTAAKKAATKTPSKKTGKKTNVAKTAAVRRSGSDVLSGPLHGVAPYEPKKNEEYMNEPQLEHFREILLNWKRELMEEVDRTINHLKDEVSNFPDPNDRATQESEFGLELKARDRERKLLRKIDSALARVDNGTYGYCEETGEEIGLKRLEARPIATLCLEAQERHEMSERHFGDREDLFR